jgi:hypothetical protein
MSNEKVTLNDLCKSCELVIPKPFLEALEIAYTPEECINIISLSIASHNPLKVINPELIEQYIKSKNKFGLIKFR